MVWLLWNHPERDVSLQLENMEARTGPGPHKPHGAAQT